MIYVSSDISVFLSTSLSLCVSYPAPRVQLPAEGAGVSPRHQALLPQHQVPAGQQQRRLTSACGETVLPHLHEAAARGLSPHQALLQLTGKGPICSDGRLASTVARWMLSGICLQHRALN